MGTSKRSKSLAFPALDYREIALYPHRPVRLRRQHRINQVADRPHAIGHAKRNCWRSTQGFMNAAKIVMRHVQANDSGVIGDQAGVQKVIDRLSAMKVLLPEKALPPENKEAAN
jgi:hypothetical protein